MARPSVLSPASPGDQPSPVPCVLPTFCTGSVGIGDARSLHPAPRLPGASQSPLGISGVDLRHRLPGHLHERQEVEFLRAAAAVAPAQEIQVPGHLGQGRGARAWPGAGQGPDSSPAGGGSRGPSLLPSPPVHRGCHPCAGTFDLSLGSTVALRVPWSGRLPPGEPDQDSSGLVLTLVSGRPCPRLRLRPCTSAPVTPVGATLAPMTMAQTVLGSCVALNEREAPGPHHPLRGGSASPACLPLGPGAAGRGQRGWPASQQPARQGHALWPALFQVGVERSGDGRAHSQDPPCWSSRCRSGTAAQARWPVAVSGRAGEREAGAGALRPDVPALQSDRCAGLENGRQQAEGRTGRWGGARPPVYREGWCAGASLQCPPGGDTAPSTGPGAHRG